MISCKPLYSLRCLRKEGVKANDLAKTVAFLLFSSRKIKRKQLCIILAYCNVADYTASCFTPQETSHFYQIKMALVGNRSLEEHDPELFDLIEQVRYGEVSI